MDTSINMSGNKTYLKCKSVVKKWEKDFVKENGRVPSKYDIKEASSVVRHAYKYYFNVKSEILETSIIDIPFDTDENNVTFNEFDVSSPLEINLDTFCSENDDNVFHAIPSVAEIGKLMSVKDAGEDIQMNTNSTWGDHLNNKKIEPQKLINTVSTFHKNISSELFKGLSFKKRNPRKLSSQKSQSKEDNEVKPDSKELNSPTAETANIIIDEHPIEKCKLGREILKLRNIDVISVNPIQNVLSKNSPCVRNINSGWLSRCSDMPSISDNSDISSQNTPGVSSRDVVDGQSKSGNKSYGLKNISINPLLPSGDELCLSDCVENSESEAEMSQNKSYGYRKIRPVVKRCKIEAQASGTASIDVAHAKVQINSSSANAQKKAHIMSDSEDSSIVKKKKPTSLKKTNNSRKTTKHSANKVAHKPRIKKSKQTQRPTSESDCDEDISTKKVNTRSKKKKTFMEDTAETVEEQNDLENYHIDDEEISFPRFPIKSSILKESNLVDGLAAALEIPRDAKRTDKSKSKVHSSQADKLQKKIDDGSLNDNFVRINLEKKVYVRGKKTMNFSKFKKQEWKNKKKMLHNTPEFPEGGVLKCFKCGQPGHMSRYCRAGKGSNLLALDEGEEEKSPFISLGDAELLSGTAPVPSISDNIVYECIDQKDSQNATSISDVAITPNDDFSVKGIHTIPETFIKLLATPLTSSNSTHLSIKPLYELSTDGTLIATPKEVTAALHLFGHKEFRGGQEIAAMRILSGLSTLVTLSTGSGKSLCYQLPAYLYAQHNRCITLVISPLVSLMEDQVTSMPDFLNAACLHTNQSPTQREKIIELIKKGNIHILLISPEAVVAGEKSTGFGAILRQLPPIAFACIDEVHCVSQWSHNFRPSYLMICRVLREKMGVRCVLGLTATATKPTMFEIVQHLEIMDGIAGVITNKPLPDNLVLTVSRDSQRDHYLLELLESERFAQCNSIIIYCIRRDECERVASLIRSSLQGSKLTVAHDTKMISGSKKRKRFSWIVEAYHAGMSAAKRRRVQQAFMNGELRIVVATVAFGMGINKADIRGVIHYNMPASFESFVQEVGRAGRDGLPAQCHVFIDRESRDRDELLRHIHANSIERHVIRKLLQKVFLPCGCSRMRSQSENKINAVKKCQGHEVSFSVDETVSELDVPSENVATLLCYLELHPKKFAKLLSNVYIMCKVISYGGPAALLKAAQTCPPLAMAIALHKKSGVELDKTGLLEFCVIEVAAAIGWDSGMVKYQLKNLEWTKQNGLPKKSLLRVEFHTLGFRVKSPGDLTSSELDEALDTLFERTQLQEKTMLQQLQQVSKALLAVSFPSIFQCSTREVEEAYTECSNTLKEKIRDYFLCESPTKIDTELDERPTNTEQVVTDVKGLIATYRDCTFTGRAVARILQGISSPNFPAIVWGRCRYWRSHISADFYKLVNIGKQQIISMR